VVGGEGVLEVQVIGGVVVGVEPMAAVVGVVGVVVVVTVVVVVVVVAEVVAVAEVGVVVEDAVPGNEKKDAAAGFGARTGALDAEVVDGGTKGAKLARDPLSWECGCSFPRGFNAYLNLI